MAEQKRVAIVGSSGGNLYGIGGSEPRRLVDEIVVQCEAAGVEVSHLQFVAADGSMDRIEGDNVTARLLTLRNGVVVDAASGTVNEVNGMAAEIDREIAAAVEAGEVDGVILVSADPKGVNSATVAAAAARKIAARRVRRHFGCRRPERRALLHLRDRGVPERPNRTRAIGYVRGSRQGVEAEIPTGHRGPERRRYRCGVAQLRSEGDHGAGPSGVLSSWP
jgi:hypothetical protein